MAKASRRAERRKRGVAGSNGAAPSDSVDSRPRQPSPAGEYLAADAPRPLPTRRQKLLLALAAAAFFAWLVFLIAMALHGK
jgi:hypothetical protein